jgi:1-acyl-sn-glycerol-3-phosphate acyltransferase
MSDPEPQLGFDRHMPSPGEFGCYDAAFVRRNAPKWKRVLHRYFRARVHGLERVPDRPFLAVGNHSGAGLIPDTLVWLSAYHSDGRATPLLTLAHDQMFASFPDHLARWVARFGAMRADPASALAALRQGSAVQVYPGGDHDACRPFSQRNQVVFAGRTGYVDLARAAGVPIIPVAVIGGHETLMILGQGRKLARRLGVDQSRRLESFPVSLSIPWGLWIGPLPGYLPLPARIEIDVLDPIDAQTIKASSTAQIDKRVREALQATIDRRAAGRIPVIG